MKLTNEEIARVFAMYGLGSETQSTERGHTYELTCISRDYLNVYEPPYPLGESQGDEHEWPIEECRIKLTPLSSITDEHAIEVAKELGWQLDNGKLSIARKHGLLQVLASESPFGNSGSPSIRRQWNIFQQLIVWGYAVPLFFGLSHWANGKTAIELGIAIEKQATKTPPSKTPPSN